jgi:predicted O-methyltransferase YrrM
MKGNAVIHYIKYLLGIEKPETQTTQQERNALQEFAKNAKCCAEIGVFEGVNTILIAESMDPGGTLYGIDPFFKGRLGVSYHELITRHSISKKKLGSRIKLLPLFSYDALNHVPDLIDFIFIDGDHSYEGIKRDWEDWSVKVKPGGIIALHDTSVPGHDPSIAELGSYRFFNEVISKATDFKRVKTVDSLNILIKNS